MPLAARAQEAVELERLLRIALRLEDPQADVEMIVAQVEDRAIELAREAQRIPVRALLCPGIVRPLDGERCRARRLVDRDLHDAVRAERGELDALAARPQGEEGELLGARFHHVGEFLRLGHVIHEPPFLRPIGAHALGGGAEEIGKVAAHLALVDQPREAAGAGQHTQQRHFRQRDGGGTVIHHRDLVARQGQLIAAAGTGAIDGGEEPEPGVLARVFNAVARLVGELAEVHLGGMARGAEHVDVRAGAEHARLAARQDDALHLRMLEADAIQRIVQLDVDAEVVAVQLELVAGGDALVLGDVERECRDGAVARELPVVVAVGMRFEIDHAITRLKSARLCRTVLPDVSTTALARP